MNFDITNVMIIFMYQNFKMIESQLHPFRSEFINISASSALGASHYASRILEHVAAIFPTPGSGESPASWRQPSPAR